LGYPYPSGQLPYYDQFGSQYSVSPLVAKSTAGSLGFGQTLVSACGRIATSATLPVTVPLFTVPTNKTFFLTDMVLSTIAAVEIDTQITAGAVPIDRAVTSSTSPICVIHETQPLATGTLVVALVLAATTAGTVNVDFFVAGYFQSQPGVN
jgi:hypothetical protein